MFNLFDDVSNLIDLVKRVRALSNLRFLDLKKLRDEFALIFLDSQKRIQRIANKFRIFLTANPFPYRKFSSLGLRNRTVDVMFNDTNSFRKSIKDTYPRIKDYTSFPLVFVDTEISVSIKKSCKPFQEVFCWNFVRSNINVFFSKWKRFFEHGKLMTTIISYLSSETPFTRQIVFKSKKLSFFYNRVRFYFFDKIHTKFIVCGYPPSPSFLSMISLSNINLTTKCLFEKIRNFFIGQFSANIKMSVFCESDIAFCVKKTCKVLHKTTLWFGKLHFTKKRQLPATTKFDDLRINSSGCHSLNNMETY